jgi:ABC-type sugar transport system ATPase subunit
MASVKLVGVRKIYEERGRPQVAVHDLDLEVGDGEFVVLVGPSGCGKSTTLRMIAGLETISAGELFIGGRMVNQVPARDRDIAMVFQNYALYPHMTAHENLGWP